MSHEPTYEGKARRMGEGSGWKARWGLRVAGPMAWGWLALLLLAGLAAALGVFDVFGGSGTLDDVDLGTWLRSMAGVWLALVIVLFLCINMVYAVQGIRRARGRVILSYVENGVRLNLPLGVFLRSAAIGEGGVTRKRLAMIAGRLDSGAGIGATLEEYVPEIPAHAVKAVSSAERIGQLQGTLSRLVFRQDSDLSLKPESQPARSFYPFVLCMSVVWILYVLIVLVFPKFEEIFKDFGAKMPPLTKHLVEWGSGLVDGPLGLLAPILLILVVVVIFGRSLRYTFTPWWPGLFVDRGVDILSWHVPYWRSLQRYRALSEVSKFLADAGRAGLALPAAIGEASQLHMNQAMRVGILRWRDGVMRGESPADAAAGAGLPGLMVGFLGTAAAPGKTTDANSLAGVFDFMADYYGNRFSRLGIMLRALGEPCVTLLMGVMVGAVVIGLFMPLVTLINSVMEMKGGGLL